MLYRIEHVTSYHYEDNASISLNVARLRPRGTPTQTVLRSSVIINPQPAVHRQYHDSFGNSVDAFTVQTAHRELVVTAHADIEVQEQRPLRLAEGSAWTEARQLLRNGGGEAMVHGFACASTYVPVGAAFAELARHFFQERSSVGVAALALCEAIHQDFSYDPRATSISTPVAEVLRTRRGVCQDFAHLMLSALRSLGLSARYVSGYLETDPPPGRSKLRGADASHAWVSVWCPTLGWIDLDPTNGCQVGARHVTLALGRDFHDASPLKGVVTGGGHHAVSVAVDVERG